MGLAALLLAAFVWVSLQVYYTYYRLIFEGLPAQWVIGWPPSLDILRLATFTGPAKLSTHSQRALFWLLAGLAFKASEVRGHAR